MTRKPANENLENYSQENNEENLQVRVQKELSKNRSQQQKDLNRTITICWAIIVFTFMISYFFEVAKGLRDMTYTILFCATMLLPLMICVIHYHNQPDDKHYGIWIICGYFIMYAFALMTGKTVMVFSYILPMLSFMVLLHKPQLVVGAGGVALALNIASVYMRYQAGEITVANSQDAEIQLALIVFCFAGAWLSSRFYNHVILSNEEALERAVRQESTIHGLENDVLIDKLTGLRNRAAYDITLSQLSNNKCQVGVIFCDANGLKYCNDHMGHQAGDQLLVDVANKLTAHFRASDCYRISGDEFVVLCSNLEENVFSIRANRFYEDIWNSPRPIISIGWDHTVSDISEAIKNAEIRMYEDKNKFYERFPECSRK